jgi:hypothetical protein
MVFILIQLLVFLTEKLNRFKSFGRGHGQVIGIIELLGFFK